MKNRKDGEAQAEYFNVSKPLFYFFYSIYGGGPAIVKNDHYQKIELAEKRKTRLQEQVKEQDSVEEDQDDRQPQYSRPTKYDNRQPESQTRKYTQLPAYEDGIVGLENNTYYCYMNACLQCLVAIEELRDHYVMQDYFRVVEGKNSHQVVRLRNSFDFCGKLHELYSMIYSKSSKQKSWVVRPTLKQLLRRKFDPIMQHDSHEFLCYLLEQLSYEETPKLKTKFNGSEAKNKSM